MTFVLRCSQQGPPRDFSSGLGTTNAPGVYPSTNAAGGRAWEVLEWIDAIGCEINVTAPFAIPISALPREATWRCLSG